MKDAKYNYEDSLIDLLDSGRFNISTVKPSDWAEDKRFMDSSVSRYKGKFSYDITPYSREIVDCLAQNHPARIVSVMKGAQIGFALSLDTVIPTPNGFTTMGEVQNGDNVLSENGESIKVNGATDVMHNHKCYEVEFTDGTKIIADAEHLWTVRDLKNVERTLNTEYISKRVKQIRKNGKERSIYYTENPKPFDCKDKELPIDPYLLGLWLGDGHTNSNRITAEVNDAREYQLILAQKGIKTVIVPYKEYEKCCSLRIVDAFNTWKGGFNIYGNKHIPNEYFTASLNQRLELLQGLIDTDGHVMKDGKVEFYNVNKDLIEDVRTLISSLGYKVTTRERDNSDKLTNMHPTRRYKMKNLFILNFMGKLELPVAKLYRKKSRLRSINEIRKEVNKKWICSVTEVESVPVKCITVDNPTNLFLVSKNYIPTHNSTGVIESGIGWIISQAPGNILFLTGHTDLSTEAVVKIDQMIDSCGIRNLIRPSIQRKRAAKTGDTNTKKEFPGGSLVTGGAGNHKMLRQRSVMYGFIDDFDAAKQSTKESGSTTKMIEQRFAAYSDKMKLFYISTPELKKTSNIEPVYLMGDQRRYHVPCPCCGDHIALYWTVEIEGSDGKEKGGITWKLDKNNRLINDSVGYICQSCGGFFDDKNKYEMNLAGLWKPTAEPIMEGYYSYHISSLYAPPGMYGWRHYVSQYLEANPPNGNQIEHLQKTFVNLCLGDTYEQQGESPKANELQKNIRAYEIGSVPEKLSEADGNGKIILLTCACDLNGIVEDARLDYEIVAWSESGSCYSIDQGSIGTFIPREGAKKKKTDRERWTYEPHRQNSVWPEFDKILANVYQVDTGRSMNIAFSGVDTGHYTSYAYNFIDNTNNTVVGLKGKDIDKYIRFGADMASFRPAKERNKLFLVEVNQVKDELADLMKLKWDDGNDDYQPPGFMNFPQPSNGKYLFNNYYSHFESEQRVVETKEGEGISARWVKKSSLSQNHFWDVRVYNIVLRDILIDLIFKEAKVRNGVWKDYVDIIMGRN